jgi:hypothetical protein
MGDLKEPSFAGPANLNYVAKANAAAVACLSALQRAPSARDAARLAGGGWVIAGPG